MGIDPSINWQYLLKAVEDFKRAGFTYVEVPWLVSEKAIRGTFNGKSIEALPGLHNIGSGEQGFIELELQGKLPKGKYVTLTPCFRDEPVIDQLHRHYFMKVELYITDDTSKDRLWRLVEWMRSYFYVLSGCKKTDIVQMSDGSIDINVIGVEVGSYGIREYEGTKWIYATGLAEPRFSTIMKAK